MDSYLVPQDKTIRGREYSTIPFGYDEGVDLLLEILEMLVGAAAAAVPSVRGVDVNALLDLDLSALVAIDWSKVGAGIVHLPRVVIQKGGSEFIARLLSKTKVLLRPAPDPGQQKARKGEWRQLDKVGRDMAFAGRYLESALVLGWVLEVNFGPFFTEMLDALKELSPEPAPRSIPSESASRASA